MADCECLGRCPFFNDKMANMPAMADMLKSRYCKGDWSTCARHRVFIALGTDGVPADLYPNQETEADEVLAAS